MFGRTNQLCLSGTANYFVLVVLCTPPANGQMDKDHDGSVSLDEFCVWWEAEAGGELEQRRADAFTLVRHTNLTSDTAKVLARTTQSTAIIKATGNCVVPWRRFARVVFV